MTDLDARRKTYRRSGVMSIVAGLFMTLAAAYFLWSYGRDPVTRVLQGIGLIGGVAAICNGWWMLRRSKTM
jgi:hypothetical protein